MIICRKSEVFAKNWNRSGWDFYFTVFRYKHQLLNLSYGGCENLREQNSERKLAESVLHFAFGSFVFELALFFTSNFQLITDVYQHRFFPNLITS